MIIIIKLNSTYIENINNKFKCAIIYYTYYKRFIEIINYNNNNYKHIVYEKNNLLKFIEYFNHIKQKHNIDGPSFIYYNNNGHILLKDYYLNNNFYTYENYKLHAK